MFYSQFILAKKGPLGTIWIAAHLERKLRKNQVADTDIGVSVDSILFPEVPIALRLSSHLLLGVVRIYSRKVNYLFDDCSEALLKIKQAFRSTAVDLPPEESKAPYHSITLPETFDLDDFELPDNEILQGNFVDHHVSTKEQITLQDTMDGVVYSTSQFGLDERFGDGDASQIGLDLDEELLLNKGTTSGHGVLLTSFVDPQTSTEASSSREGGKLDEEMHEASQAVVTNCSIEAPATPGLVEGLSLPSGQEALVGDDHMEEDRNPIEFVAEDKGRPASSYVEDGTDQAAVRDNGCTPGNQKIEESSSQVRLPSNAEPMELIVSSNVAHMSGLNKAFETSEGVDVECIQSGSLGKSDMHGGLAVKYSGERGGAQEIGLNESDPHKSPLSVQPDHCHEKSSVNGFYSVSESTSEHAIEAEGKLHINSNSENKGSQDFTRQEASEISNAEAHTNTLGVGKPILQPCDLNNNQENAELDNVVPNLPSQDFPVCSEGMSGKEDARDVANLNSNEDRLLDATPCNKLDEQPVISENVQSQKENDSVASELPSPEKMLSVPDVPVSQSNELFVGSTPEREVHVQGDQDVTMNKISGKKRSLTESTITLQSLNSVESSEATQSKRSVEFVPDDDDLLSSILVGRRSTMLKVKSTPPAFDLVSSKRPRVTPRSGAHKRKVLVDDSMVLHGDIIRQQLVNTEDIRRVRKKAPSTQPEIWILRKQFLEDEMFNEPLFTGMSAQLISLHCQPYDLSGTKLVQDDGSKTDSTAMDLIGSPVRPSVGEETEFEGNNVPPFARDESAQQSVDLGGNAQENERVTEREVGCTSSQFDILEMQTEMEVECRREPIGDVTDQSVALGAEPSTFISCVRENNATLITGDMIQSSCMKDANGADVSEQVGGSLLNLDEQSGGKDAVPIEDISEVGIDFGEVVDRAADGGPVEHRSEEGHLAIRMEDVNSAVPIIGGQPECPLPVNDGKIEAEDNEGKMHEPGRIKDEFPGSDLQYDDMGSLFIDHQREDINYLNPEGDLGPGNAVFAEGVNLDNQFAESQIFMEATTAASDHPSLGNLNDLEADAIEPDTDFLNFDDDEIAEEDDNPMPNAEGPQILDNSGWSTRTRAVANYLQVLFQKEAQHGRKVLHLDNLLANKSRKEASRMFFETLVLKTRDYIHVEQEGAFDNIGVKPRARLLKS